MTSASGGPPPPPPPSVPPARAVAPSAPAWQGAQSAPEVSPRWRDWSDAAARPASGPEALELQEGRGGRPHPPAGSKTSQEDAEALRQHLRPAQAPAASRAAAPVFQVRESVSLAAEQLYLSSLKFRTTSRPVQDGFRKPWQTKENPSEKKAGFGFGSRLVPTLSLVGLKN